MCMTSRQYDRDADFGRVGEFLVRTCNTDCRGHRNWLQPRWEYMHYHPQVRDVDLGAIRLWEEDGRIVAVAHPELRMGTAHFEISPEHPELKAELLAYAQERLSVATEKGRRLYALICDTDTEFHGLAAAAGFARSEHSQSMSHLAIPDPFPPLTVPSGFRLKSLAEDNDLVRLHRAIWRGFDHGDEPPDDGIGERRFMQSAPNYRKDLNIVVVAPDGSFVSYCGTWLEPVHGLAYVEPVATDPGYRRRGLGGAAVLEAIRRAGRAGARKACVATSMPFYLSLGFREVYAFSAWVREWQ